MGQAQGLRFCCAAVFLAVVMARGAASQSRVDGTPRASLAGSAYSVGNGFLQLRWQVKSGHVGELVLQDRVSRRTVRLGGPFWLQRADGTVDSAMSMTVSGRPTRRDLKPEPTASRMADRLAGVEIDTPMSSVDGALTAVWSVILMDGSEYVRQQVTLTAGAHDVKLRRVRMLEVELPGAAVVGSVKGSPIVSGDLYLGFEDPLSTSRAVDGQAVAFLDRKLPLKAGASVTYSSVAGVTHPGQLRRDFLSYIERERAHPYRTFLHYNTWYDLGRFNPYDEAGALDRIHAIGEELHVKRGVTLDSFLFDDGWDSHSSLWGFNEGFPHGFDAVKAAAATYGTQPGVWMSPWGGYSKPKQERLGYGREQGFEIVSNGFALSGPKYYARFEEVCLEMVRRYGINQFKFDGTGNADSVFKGSAFDSDFAAAIHLIGVLRQAKPDLFVNLTTGTYPSPFWLRYADSIWRGGEDDDVSGVGPYRERWITYRDADTYDEVVQNGPLYPLNSVMLHGIIYAEKHKQLMSDPSNDFRNEVRSYFGTGTQTQELYITPSLLTPANWDDLAEAARWSRTNADVLRDTHWVGGDPAWLEVYGWASWSPRKSILVLRNPSDKVQSIMIDPKAALELPEGGGRWFSAHSPWHGDAAQAPVILKAGQPHLFRLQPFEVLTLDLKPN
jgi:hypothetical protein